MKKFLSITMAFVMACGIALPAFAADRVLANVNGTPIFESDFLINQAVTQYQQVAPQADQTPAKMAEFRAAILNQRIDQILLLQQAKKEGIKVTKKQINDRIAQIKTTNFQTEAAFRDYLKSLGLSNSEFEKNISDQLVMQAFSQKFASDRIAPPTEDQVRTFYKQIQDKAAGRKIANVTPEQDAFITNVTDQLKRVAGPRVRWSLIFVSQPPNATQQQVTAAREKINQIKTALKKNDFGQVAAQYSDEESSRQRGGDMGVVLKGDLAQGYPAVDKALFTLGVGKYTTEPIKTDIGWFFVKVQEKEPGRNIKDITFDQVGQQLTNIMYENDANQALAQWLADVRSKAKIVINN
jgi:parvulin-like peptidyl-prolyl isomerase